MTLKRKGMVSKAALLAGALVLTVGLAGEAISQMRLQVRSWIGQGCARNYSSFTVPAGKTATSFRIEGLTSGRTCTTNQNIDTQGFQIRDANYNNVFVYSTSGGRVSNSGPIAQLTLGPGNYSLSVDGGNGAAATVSYTLQ